VIHQKNAGCSAARNAGMDWVFSEAQCQWVAFIDSDHWIHRDYLRLLMEAAELHHVKISVCDCIWTAESCEDAAQGDEKAVLLSAEDAFVKHYEACIPPWGKLIHRSLLEDIRFPVGIRYEDAAVSHIWTLSTDTIAVCPQKLYYYFCNENSFTRTAWTEGRLQVVKVHQDRLDYLRLHGYNKACCRELEAFADRITENLLYLTDLVEKDQKYVSIFEDLRQTLRRIVKEAETVGAFRFDRERLMTYAYVSRGDLLWKTARGLQRIWRKVLKR